jgi:hypothetical protein
MSHLSKSDVIDALDGTLSQQARRHLASCASCEAEVERLRGVLARISAVEVREPSPLFWSHLVARVSAAVAKEKIPRPAASAWFPWRSHAGTAPSGAVARWAVAAALTVTSLLAGAMLLEQNQSEPRSATPAAADARGGSAEMATDNWETVVEMAEQAPWDEVQASGLFARPSYTEQALTELTSEERLEIVRLLNEAIDEEESGPGDGQPAGTEPGSRKG